jgi:protoheme IX farnesyltransferase
MTTVAASSRAWPVIVDLVALTKPRVTALVLATAAVGMGLAPGVVDLTRALVMLGATVLLVGSANALNCWLERDTDAFMKRTCDRPLPAGRLDPFIAVVFAVALAAIALPVLSLSINLTTGLLGAGAIVSYVAIYTPLKYRGPVALLVGAVPGALPPLMGWTSVTGSLGWGGFSLFAIVFAWQMPHVIGLSTYRRNDYAAAGIRVLPLVAGVPVARQHAIAWALAMLPIGAAPFFLGLTGYWYLAVSLLLGGAYTAATLAPLGEGDDAADRWGRRVFLISLFYIPVAFTALMLDLAGG